jgi:hypothetical protein
MVERMSSGKIEKIMPSIPPLGNIDCTGLVRELANRLISFKVNSRGPPSWAPNGVFFGLSHYLT